MRHVRISVVVAAAIAAVLYGFFPPDAANGDGNDQLRASDLPEMAAGDTVEGNGNARTPTDRGRLKHPQPMAADLPVTTRTRGGIGSAPYAATEQAMLSGGMINDKAIQALQSGQFDRLLTRFETEQGGMTGEITVAYRAELQRLLGSVAEPKQIDRLVCGTELCIASIRSPSRAWYPAWFESMQGRSRLPMHALTGNSIDLAGSGVEYRLLFSISDGVKGFAGSAPRS